MIFTPTLLIRHYARLAYAASPPADFRAAAAIDRLSRHAALAFAAFTPECRALFHYIHF